MEARTLSPDLHPKAGSLSRTPSTLPNHSPPTNLGQGQRSKRKTIRPCKPISCEPCRRAKVKCSREAPETPCKGCIKGNKNCIVTGTDNRTNKTTDRKLEAKKQLFETVVGDYGLLFQFLGGYQTEALQDLSKTRNTIDCLMSNACSPSQCAKALRNEGYHGKRVWNMPNYMPIDNTGFHLADRRRADGEFSKKAWEWIKVLQTTLIHLASDRSHQVQRQTAMNHALGRDSGMRANFVERWQLPQLTAEQLTAITDYEKKLIRDEGLEYEVVQLLTPAASQETLAGPAEEMLTPPPASPAQPQGQARTQGQARARARARVPRSAPETMSRRERKMEHRMRSQAQDDNTDLLNIDLPNTGLPAYTGREPGHKLGDSLRLGRQPTNNTQRSDQGASLEVDSLFGDEPDQPVEDAPEPAPENGDVPIEQLLNQVSQEEVNMFLQQNEQQQAAMWAQPIPGTVAPWDLIMQPEPEPQLPVPQLPQLEYGAPFAPWEAPGLEDPDNFNLGGEMLGQNFNGPYIGYDGNWYY